MPCILLRASCLSQVRSQRVADIRAVQRCTQDPRLSQLTTDAIHNARAAGVEQLACNGTCEDDWGQVLELAASHPHVVIPNLGLHPWFVSKRSVEWLDVLRENLVSNPSAGLGECGLDKAHYGPDAADIATQEEVFVAQLLLAKELHRPVSVHCVKAFGMLQQLLQRHGPFHSGVILHSWMGSAEMVKSLAALPGVYFSLSGLLTKMSPAKARLMVPAIPSERLLLETDSPDGLPHSSCRAFMTLRQNEAPSSAELSTGTGNAEHEQQNMSLNQPANVRIVAEIVAGLRGQPTPEVAEAAFVNSLKAFAPVMRT